VRKTDKLVCKWAMQLIDESPGGEEEEVAQVFTLTDDGFAGCHIGYIPKRYYYKFGFRRFDLMYLKLHEDYRFSDNSAERQRSYKSNGMVLCSVIKDNNRYNGRNPFDGEQCDVSDSEFTSTTYVRGIAGHTIGKMKKIKEKAKKKIVRKTLKVVEENFAPPTVTMTGTSMAESVANSVLTDNTNAEKDNAKNKTTGKTKQMKKKTYKKVKGNNSFIVEKNNYYYITFSNKLTKVK
jgi:hypothetical protein